MHLWSKDSVDKLVCLSKPVKVTDKHKTLAHNVICPCYVHPEPLMFQSTSPGVSKI